MKKLAYGEGIYDKAISAFIDAYWKQNKRPPAMREIADAVGSSSTSVIKAALQRVTAYRRDFVSDDTTARGIVPQWAADAIDNAIVPTVGRGK